MGEIRCASAAVVNEIGFDDVVWASAMPGKGGWIVIFRADFLIVNVRNGADGNTQDTIGRRCDAPGIKLQPCSRKIK
jgi:hypothetical protein